MGIPSVRAAVLLLIGAVAAPAAAPAESAPAAPVPEDAEEGFFSQEDLTLVTPTKGEVPLAVSPSSVAVITAEEIRLSGARTLADLLRRVAGVEVRTITAGQVEIGPRGFAEDMAKRTLILIDGRTAHMDWIGGTPVATLPLALEDIERIEVVKGPGGSLYGNKAFMGVVNIITRRPHEGSSTTAALRGGELLLNGGSFWHGTARGPLKMVLRGRFRRDEELGQNRDLLAPDSTAVGASLALGWEEGRRSLWAEAGSDWVRLFILPTTASPIVRFEGEARYARADGRFPLGDDWDLTLLAYANQGEASSPEFPRDAPPFITSFFTGHAEARAAGRHALLGASATATLGAEARLMLFDSTVTSAEQPISNGALFAQEEVHWERTSVTAGLRGDLQTLVPGPTLSPRLALVWTPFDGHYLRAAVGRGYNNPSHIHLFSDFEALPGISWVGSVVGGGNLRAETIDYAELGWRSFFASRLAATLELYLFHTNDFIDLDFGSVAAQQAAGGPVNIEWTNLPGGYWGGGGELDFSYAVTPSLTVQGHYALNLIRNVDRIQDPSADAGTARHKLAAGARWSPREGFRAQLFAQLGSPTEFARTLPGCGALRCIIPMPPIIYLEATAGWRFAGGLELLASVTNPLAGEGKPPLNLFNAPEFPGGENRAARVSLTLRYEY